MRVRGQIWKGSSLRERESNVARSLPPLRALQRSMRCKAGRDHHVVHRGWEILQKRLQGGRIVGVEGRGVLCVEFKRCLLEALAIGPGEDDPGALGSGSPGGFQPNASAAADDDNGLAEQFRFALDGYGSGVHDATLSIELHVTTLRAQLFHR